MRRATLLDLDGVLVDSMEETLVVALGAYTGFDRPAPPSTPPLFRRYRGLVGPVWHYLALLRAIDSGDADDVEGRFSEERQWIAADERERFEHMFFALRTFYQRNLTEWLNMNPLTEFGSRLVARDLPDHYVITTKPAPTARMLLGHHGIAIQGIMGWEDFEAQGSKGAVIASFFATHPEFECADFVDDNTEHLDTVADERVSCFFADWGYGRNTHYPVYPMDRHQ